MLNGFVRSRGVEGVEAEALRCRRVQLRVDRHRELVGEARRLGLLPVVPSVAEALSEDLQKRIRVARNERCFIPLNEAPNLSRLLC